MAATTIAHVDGETGFSGGQVQVFLLLEGLRERGFRNLLCCPPGSRSEEEATKRGFEVRPVVMKNDLHLAAAWRLARIFREDEVGLVHLHTGRANALGGLGARLARRPAVTTRRMDGAVRRHPFNRMLYGTVARRSVAISPAIATQLADGGVAPERIRIISSSVDSAGLTAARPRGVVRAELGLSDDDFVLLIMAQLTKRKGVDVALKAVASLLAEGSGPSTRETSGTERLHLLVAGDGPERAALEQQARGLGLAEEVTFLGHRPDKADLLGACDVFVMPSRREGLGVAALEALASARPVVASDIGGLADTVLDEKCGLLVPPGDPEALASALARLLNDPALLTRLGEAGPARVDDGFRSDQMIDAYVALYQEVLAEAAAA